MEISGKNIIVAGLGRSGTAAVELLKKVGANIYVYDIDSSKAKTFAEKFKVSIFENFNISTFDMIVVSPSIAKNSEIITNAQKMGIEVISELELGYQYTYCDIIAVTGTNGKSSIVKMVNKLLKYAGISCQIGGNIGIPLCSFAEKLTMTDVAILETSSFQLENIKEFHSHIAILSNITPDHLERHGSMQAYMNEKSKLFLNMDEKDYIIVNQDDPNALAAITNKEPQVYCFSKFYKVMRGIFLDEERIVYNDGYKCHYIANTNEIPTKVHMSNALALLTVAAILHIPFYTALRSISHFEPEKYTLRECVNINGVKIINDSKATNTAATLADLSTLSGKTILILGGRSKGEDYKNIFVEKKEVEYVVYGENSEIIENASKIVGKKIFKTIGLKEAFYKAMELANGECNVLFAPASSSFDMFYDYIDRGDAFDKIVFEYVKEQN